MPTEIADSDAESDFEGQLNPLPGSTLLNSTDAINVSQVISVDFDQFISQSQKRSQENEVQNDASKYSTGSTEKLLRDIGAAQRDLMGSSVTSDSPDMNGTAGTDEKRRDTALHGASTTKADEGDKHERARKRAKTSRSRMGPPSSSPTYDEFMNRDPSSEMSEQTSFEDQIDTAKSGAATMQPPISGNYKNEVGLRQRDGHRKAIDLLNGSHGGSNNLISTTRSSMGMFESINLNFRDSTNSIDINHNPFGRASQLSTDEEMGLDEQQIHVQLLGNDLDPSSNLPLAHSDDSQDPLGLLGSPGETSRRRFTLGRSNSINPSALMRTNPTDTQLLSSSASTTSRKRRKTAHEGSDTGERSGISKEELTLPLINADTISSTTVTTAKRSDGSVKNLALAPSSSCPNDREELEVDVSYNALPEGQPGTRLDNGIVNAIENAGQASHGSSATVLSKKKGRKASRKSTLDAKAVQKQDESSPAKQPTSEINLSDEAFVGLPREKYKPRPSRSRSNRAVEENPNPMVEKDQAPADESPMKASTPNILSPKSTKKGKKSKVRRAKTSAAALLKKSEPMISEGEEDVVWMDTKPAKVKLDVPQDLRLSKNVKEEQLGLEKGLTEPIQEDDSKETTRIENEEYADDDDNDDATAARNPKFTIEIPPPLPPAPATEPKKRGRKGKKTLEVLADKQITEEAHENQNESPELDHTSPKLHDRPVLVSKDVNTPQSPSQEVHTSNKIILPLPSSTPSKDDQDGQKSTPPVPVPGPEPILQAATTPSPSKKSITSGKGPTKHSPINPSGGKTNYRVGLSRRTAIPSLLKILRPPKPGVKKNDEGANGGFKILRLEGEERALLDD